MAHEHAEMGGCRAKAGSGPSVGLGEGHRSRRRPFYADQVPSSPGRLWSKGSRSAGAEAGRSKGEGGSTERNSCWGGPRAGARGGARAGRSRCSRIWRMTGGSVRKETIRISPRPTLRVGARQDSEADRSRRPGPGAEPIGSGPVERWGSDPGCAGRGRSRLQERGRRRPCPPRRPVRSARPVSARRRWGRRRHGSGGDAGVEAG
jgi:hypothetical protein